MSIQSARTLDGEHLQTPEPLSTDAASGAMHAVSLFLVSARQLLPD